MGDTCFFNQPPQLVPTGGRERKEIVLLKKKKKRDTTSLSEYFLTATWHLCPEENTHSCVLVLPLSAYFTSGEGPSFISRLFAILCLVPYLWTETSLLSYRDGLPEILWDISSEESISNAEDMLLLGTMSPSLATRRAVVDCVTSK